MAEKRSAFAVIAEFRVPAEHREAFLDLCRYDAVRSVEDEPGCRQFDVSVSAESPETIVLYEIYDSRAAFDTHRGMPHFTKFSDGLTQFGVETVGARFFDRQHP